MALSKITEYLDNWSGNHRFETNVMVLVTLEAII